MFACENACVRVCVFEFKCVMGAVNEQTTALCEVRSHDLQRQCALPLPVQLFSCNTSVYTDTHGIAPLMRTL